MADFCKQCSEELFDKDFEELSGLCQEGFIANVICEGCGMTEVDHAGECRNTQCLKKHGVVHGN
jgi:hypothetical protein